MTLITLPDNQFLLDLASALQNEPSQEDESSPYYMLHQNDEGQGEGVLSEFSVCDMHFQFFMVCISCCLFSALPSCNEASSLLHDDCKYTVCVFSS